MKEHYVRELEKKQNLSVRNDFGLQKRMSDYNNILYASDPSGEASGTIYTPLATHTHSLASGL